MAFDHDPFDHIFENIRLLDALQDLFDNARLLGKFLIGIVMAGIDNDRRIG